MTIYSRNCYTYLIGWSKLNIWYYGSKYGKDANPNTFWINYFTSSKNVKQFRKEYGEPDIVQIRKTFGESVDACLNWEHKVLTKISAMENHHFFK